METPSGKQNMFDNEPWFVGKDVAEALGYANTKNAVPKHVLDEDKLSTQIEYAGQRRTVTVINELVFMLSSLEVN